MDPKKLSALDEIIKTDYPNLAGLVVCHNGRRELEAAAASLLIPCLYWKKHFPVPLPCMRHWRIIIRNLSLIHI